MPETPLKEFALRFSFEGKLPGEEAYCATLHYAEKVRESMDPEIRKGYDELNLKLAKAFWAMFGID